MGQKKGVNPREWQEKCGKPRRGGKGPCQALMMKNGRGCRIHGGTTPTGMKSIQTSEMPRYTQAVKNSKLAERYERAKKDVALLELNDEIAIIQALIEDLLTRFDSGDSRIGIKILLKCYEDMVDAGLNKKWATYNKKMDELGDLLKDANYQFSILEDVKSSIRLKKELVESQSKREIHLEQMMKAEDVMLLIKVVLGEVRGVINDRITDRVMAQGILNEVSEKVAGHLKRPNS